MFASEMVRRALPLVLALILILLSLFPRSVDVLNGNPVFTFDQGRDYLAVKSIVVDKKLTLIGAELGAGSAGISYLFHGPGYFYLLAIPFILFDGDPRGGTVLMLVLGLATIAFGFYFSKKMWGLYAGILTGLLLAASPYLAPQSRFVWNPHGPTLFILLAFYFTYLLTKHAKPLFIFLAAFFSAFTYNFELAVAVPLSITLFLYCIFTFKMKKVEHYIPLIAGFLLGYLPMLLFELRHGFMGFQSLYTYLLGPSNVATENYPFVQRARDVFGVFLFNFADTFPLRLLIPPLPAFIAFFALICIAFKKERDKVLKRFLLFLATLIPVSFAIFSNLKSGVYNYYLTELTLAYILLFTYGVTWFYKNNFKKVAAALLSFFVILVILSIPEYIKTSINDYHDYGATAKLKGKIDAIDFIYKDAGKEPFNLLVFSPPVYTYPYDYLIWWYGSRKYNFIPGEEKKGTFYLLIEPDPQKPLSHIGWQQTVIKSGKIIKEIERPSGFIVQKRISE